MRIAGVNIPQEKTVETSLTYIFGVGHSRASEILGKTGVDSQKRVKELSENEANRLRQEVEGSYTVEGELRSQQQRDVKRLREISSYRGLRHKKGLPVRGQQTQTNARTRKGRKMTVSGTSSRKSQPSAT